MPVATAGLLAMLEEAQEPTTACWEHDGRRPRLRVQTDLAAEEIADLVVDAEWPSPERIAWPAGSNARRAQAIKPVLEKQTHPADAFRAMVARSPAPEQRFLRGILTDAVLDDKGVPSRSRLLRGVKSDLSGVSNRPTTVTSSGLARELSEGPDFHKGQSGLGLGLVPEVQTFGGTTGPEASTVGGHSPLLYMLLWKGVVALPPVGVERGHRKAVGGALVTGNDGLSWPVWRVPVGLRALRSLFCLDAIHTEAPESEALGKRGIAAVYRARAVELSTMVAVYRWGTQVA